MAIKHKKQSSKTTTSDTSLVGAVDWNDTHQVQVLSTVYAANATALVTDEVIECNGTFTLTLPSAAANNGLFYRIINIGSGVVTIADAAAATFNADATYQLSNPWQSVSVQSNGTRWNVIGQAN